MMMEAKKVAAVVLTYNRLPLLKECIAALQSQSIPPDAIIVVDNGSMEDTGQWLQSQKDLQVISITLNIGPAAGMTRGFKEAYDSGFQWIWAMDDDGLPHKEALQKLLFAKPDVIGAKNSIVLDKEDKKSLVFKLLHFQTIDDIKTEFVEGEIMPWNGTLLHRDVIKELGYPKSELFLWGEEVEYYYRIKTSGKFALFSVKDSWHFHPRNNGFFYKGKWDVATNDRAYYFIRNKYAVYLSMYKQNKLRASLKYLLFNAGMFYYILFRQQQQKTEKIKLQWLAAKDGFAGNYKKSPSLILSVLKKL